MEGIHSRGLHSERIHLINYRVAERTVLANRHPYIITIKIDSSGIPAGSVYYFHCGKKKYITYFGKPLRITKSKRSNEGKEIFKYQNLCIHFRILEARRNIGEEEY